MRRYPILPLILGLSLGDCSDTTDPPPADGTLAVSTSTSGDDPDLDGFELIVDGNTSVALLPSGAAEVALSPGRHTLQLTDVAEHCSVTPGTAVEVDITAGRTAPVTFQVSCPLTGARITVTTTGFDLDPDGYRVVADGSDRGAIASTGTVVTKLDPGSRTISLAGLASNCAIDGSAAHTVTIVTAEVATIDFVVLCTEVTSPSGFIWGHVIHESGPCIRGGMVEIVAGPGMGRTSGQPDTCDAWSEDGWVFNDLPLGATVTLRATAPGYQPKDLDVMVLAGGVAPVQFVLQPNAALDGGIAFASSGHIYVMDADGSHPMNLTTGTNNFDPAWSPDGRRIAFARFHDIFVMNADGSNPVNLTFMNGDNQSRRKPAWSPDGRRIAFIYRGDIYVINPDGSNVVNFSDVILRNMPGYPVFAPTFESLAWSPDGTRIAFVFSSDYGYADIYVANVDGSNPRNLTRNGAIDDRSPAWSPDSRHIAYARRNGLEAADIYVMDANGFAVVNLSNNPASDREPAWSPDGTRIAFASDREDSAFDIYVMDADGRNPIRLTDRTRSDRSPAWAGR